MHFTVRHSIPGRIRLRIPELCRRQALAERTLTWLRSRKGIRDARINFDCSSLVLEFDPEGEAVLKAILNGLSQSSAKDLARLLGANGAADLALATATTDSARSPIVKPRRVPLALPTLSLALAFSTNPVVVAVNLPLMVWNAYPIARRAWRVLRRERRLNVDFLDILAITASLLQGDPRSGAIVTWLIRFGDWIRDLTAVGSRRAISELLEFQSKTAWLLRDGVVVSIPVAKLAVGDEIVVYPGETIPVDGEILKGRATIDQKTITGEGLPVVRGKGEA